MERYGLDNWEILKLSVWAKFPIKLGILSSDSRNYKDVNISTSLQLLLHLDTDLVNRFGRKNSKNKTAY